MREPTIKQEKLPKKVWLRMRDTAKDTRSFEQRVWQPLTREEFSKASPIELQRPDETVLVGEYVLVATKLVSKFAEVEDGPEPR